MKAFLYHLSCEFKSGVRDKSLMLMNYLFPLLVFVLIAAIMSRAYPAFAERMVPAMIMFAMMSSLLLAMPGAGVSAREAGIFRSYRINGVPALSILLVPVLSLVLHVLVASVIITAVAILAFGAPAPDFARLAFVWLASVIAIAGLGCVILVVSPNSRATILLSQVIFLPSMMIGGLMMPPEILPPVLAKIALILPSSHTMRALMEFGTAPGWISIGVLAAGGLCGIVVAALLFEWDVKPQGKALRKLLALGALLPYLVAVLLPAVPA